MDPESGRKTGYWIITGEMKPKEGYNAENKIEEGVYINSRKNGIWIKYWPNGNIRSEINFKNGRTNGAYTTIFKMEMKKKGKVIAGMMGEFTILAEWEAQAKEEVQLKWKLMG